jgi:hypothetical protein
MSHVDNIKHLMFVAYSYSENHISLSVTSNLVVLEPTISLRCVDHHYAISSHDWCDVNFSYTMFFVLLHVGEQVTKEPGTQQVENSEQELVEGKLCP